MRRLYLIIIYMCLTLVVGRVHAQYYSVNYDKQIVAAMAAAFGAGAMAESYYNEQVGEILKHYNAAEVATAGIFAAKFLERKAFTDLGIWSSSTENYYYRRIHNMVANKDYAQDMDGGRNDAEKSADRPLLGQLPDEDMRRHKVAVYAV